MEIEQSLWIKYFKVEIFEFWNTFRIMFRIIPAPKDRLTPFDLRGHIFRVSVEVSTYLISLIILDKNIFRKKRPKVTFHNSSEKEFFSRKFFSFLLIFFLFFIEFWSKNIILARFPVSPDKKNRSDSLQANLFEVSQCQFDSVKCIRWCDREARHLQIWWFHFFC